MSAPEILSWLNSHADARLDTVRVNTRTLNQWLDEMDASTRAGIRRAWLVGRVLNAQRARLPHGEVEKWERGRARELRRKVRTLQLYRYIAEAMDDPEIVTGLRISHADQGLKALAGVIRRLRRQKDGRTPKPPRNKAAVWQARAERLLTDLPATPDQAALLEAHIAAATAHLKKLRSAAPPARPEPIRPSLRDAARAHLEQLQAQGQQNILQAARWTMGLLVADLSGQFPTQQLTEQHLRTFLDNHANARSRNSNTGAPLRFRDLHASLFTAIAWWSTQGWCTYIRPPPV
jgi:hypothetical protein